MISKFLHYLYNLDIYISVNNKKLLLKYKKIDLKTKEKIKEQKPLLIKRITENEAATKKGFTVYNFGDFYEFRYGLNSFLFLERLDCHLATAWRANYRQDDARPTKIVIVAKEVPFDEAFQQASGFIDWLNRQNGRRNYA